MKPGSLQDVLTDSSHRTALAYFGPQIFGLLTGNDKQQALLITGLFGAQKFVTCSVYVFGFSERWNRKAWPPLLMQHLSKV